MTKQVVYRLDRNNLARTTNKNVERACNSREEWNRERASNSNSNNNNNKSATKFVENSSQSIGVSLLSALSSCARV